MTMTSSSAMATKSHAARARFTRGAGVVSNNSDPGPLSKSQLREIQRRIRDVENRSRYLLVSAFTRRVVLYYDVSNDTFAMTEPTLGTLFKRRAAAIAIQRLLRTGVQVVRCRVDRVGRVVKSSVPRVRPTWPRPVVQRRLRSTVADRRA